MRVPASVRSEPPAGDYWIQPFVNVYSERKRFDGHGVPSAKTPEGATAPWWKC